MPGEDAFVLACLTHRLLPDHLLPPRSQDLDWDVVEALLFRHNLTGVFYRLGLEQPGLWPQTLQNRLRREYHSALLWGDRCLEEVRTVLAALGGAGIPSIVLKGWAAIPTIYGGDHGQRTYSDIDLLVQPRDAARAEQIVESLGYRARTEPWPGFDRRFCNNRPFQLAKDAGAFGQVFAIALHWHLLDTPFFFGRMPAAPFFARSRRVRLSGMELSVLEPEDHLVYACGHLALHHRYDEALFRYYELAWGLLRAGQAFDWSAVLQRTEAWRLVLPVQRVLRRLEGLWPGIVPSAVSDSVQALTPSRSEQFVHRWVVAETPNPAVRAALAWLTMPGFGRRWRYALEQAFPGPNYLTQRYGPAPGGLWPLLYVRRIALAARYAITAAARLLRRRSKHTLGADVAR